MAIHLNIPFQALTECVALDDKRFQDEIWDSGALNKLFVNKKKTILNSRIWINIAPNCRVQIVTLLSIEN